MKPSPMITSPLLRRLITRARDLQAGKGRAAAALVRRLMDNTAGMAAVEFAILSPVLLAMLLGMFSFGLAMKDYMVLTSAAAQGALTIALSRGTATPYGTTQAAILAATSSLTTPANVLSTITINGVACTSNAICTTNLVAGRSALVTATYPCTLSVMGINYKPNGCTLTASTAQMIQ